MNESIDGSDEDDEDDSSSDSDKYSKSMIV